MDFGLEAFGRGVARRADCEDTLEPLATIGCYCPQAVHQYSRTATSKYQVRRISITSKSRINLGGNAW